MSQRTKVPVTILTGFLGAGKTTLLNRILSEHHGKRIAVIENEYGELGIDQALVVQADEEIFEMSNGCICCTVRGDLIRVLNNLMKRRDRFDYVLVETTGLADPGPVAQTFFMDDEISEEFALDGIVTLVDAKHIHQQLGRSRESTEQIAFADVILLNKVDLVDARELDSLESRLRDMNRMARIVRSEQAKVPLSCVLNLAAFDLDQALQKRPTFLEPEYPFEWTGVYELKAGSYELSLVDGPDPTMSLAIADDLRPDPEALIRGAEWCVRQYAEPSEPLEPSQHLKTGTHVELQLQQGGRKSFPFVVEHDGTYTLFTQHTAEEFGLELCVGDGVELVEGWNSKPSPLLPPPFPDPLRIRGARIQPVLERTWVAEHEHDDEVGSVAIEVDGDVDSERLDTWLTTTLRTKGVDIFRMKGFISVAGDARRFVFQGVHMLFEGRPERPWGKERRRNQLVFIGRNLDAQQMRQGFAACLN